MNNNNFFNFIKTHFSALFSATVAFLLPILPLLLIVGLFIFADTLTAIYRNKKLGVKFSSRLCFNSIAHKSFIYLGAVVLCFMMEKYMLVDIINIFIEIPYILTKIIATTFCLIELKSIDENYKILTGISLLQKFFGFLKRVKSVKDDIKDLTK